MRVDLQYMRDCVRFPELVVFATCDRTSGRFGLLRHRLDVGRL